MNKEELFKKLHPQDGDLPQWASEFADRYATSQTKTLKKELKFCLDIIDKYVDDFRLSQKDIDRLKLLLETF